MQMIVLAGSIAVAAAVVAAPAQAATRYATPSGSSNPTCTQAAPCDVKTAIEGAGNNDTIEVGAGIYVIGLDSINATASGLTVKGPSPQNRPVISSIVTGVLTMANGGTVRDLKLTTTGAGAFSIAGGGTAERLDVSAAGFACSVAGGAILRDSVCYANGPSAAGVLVSSSTALLANVTAIASGTNSAGLMVGGGGAITGSNVIAQGGSSDALASGAASTITLDHSAYATESEDSGGSVTNPGSPTNITTPPAFVLPAMQDFRQEPYSPTIDAGTTGPLIGSLDLEGDPRNLGSAPDIGADERVPLPATPPADTAPPETTIDKSPKKKSESKKATFKFSSSEAGSTFICKVDKKAEAPCTSPLKLKRLKKGKHKLTVVATDAAGNADASAASYAWKVKKKTKKKG